MKPLSTHFLFLISLLCHALVFFLGGFLMTQKAEYGFESGLTSVEVDLVAAPLAEEQVEEPTPEEAMEMPETEPEMPAPDDMVIPEPEKIAPAKPVYRPQPVVKPVKQENTGDGSSPVPGNDATTLKAERGTVSARAEYKRNPPPPYPESARRAGQQGIVILRISITAEGRVSGATVKKSSGHAILDQSALKAVASYRFKPARVGGFPVASEEAIPFRFTLDKAE